MAAGRHRPGPQSRRADEVAAQIRNLIISEQITEGARLPPERELAERFGASRPTVSQALRSLSLMGLVEIRHGSGAYVIRRPETMVTASVSLMLDLDNQSVDQLMQLRLWLETLGAGEAAARRPPLEAAEAAGSRPPSAGCRTPRAGTSRAGSPPTPCSTPRWSGRPATPTWPPSTRACTVPCCRYQFRGWVDARVGAALADRRRAGAAQALHEPIAAAVIAQDPAAAHAAVLAHHDAMLEHTQLRG